MKKAVALLLKVFQVITTINSTKDSLTYWTAVNREFLNFDRSIAAIYKEERIALIESIQIAKEEGLFFLSKERKRIMSLSHQEAIKQLIEEHNIENRMKVIQAVSDNSLFQIS